MTVFLAVLLALCIAGIVCTAVRRKNSSRKRLNTGILVVLSLCAAALGLYLLLVGLLLHAIQVQPPAGEEPPPTQSAPPETPEPTTTPAPAPTPTPEPLVADPDTFPDILGITAADYGDMPHFEDIPSLSRFALAHFLDGSYEFECYLSHELASEEGIGFHSLYTACDNAMAYYPFSAYYEYSMFTEDRGDEEGVYGYVKLEYHNPEYDDAARAAAAEFVNSNPAPKGGFTDYGSERAYALKIHDYIAKKITYSPIGYDPEAMIGMRRYEGKQEAWNALVEEGDSAVCAGYARAFALIAQYAGIEAVWVWGNETEISSHAWNIVYPCDGSEPVIVDVTWDDGNSMDEPGQTEVFDGYFYVPLSEDTEHSADPEMSAFLDYIQDLT